MNSIHLCVPLKWGSSSGISICMQSGCLTGTLQHLGMEWLKARVWLVAVKSWSINWPHQFCIKWKEKDHDESSIIIISSQLKYLRGINTQC